MNPPLWSLLVLALGLSAGVCAAPATVNLPECQLGQLRLQLSSLISDDLGPDDGNIQINLQNTGDASCRTEPRPDLHFADAQGQELVSAAAPIPGMHPGPVIFPPELAPGAVLISQSYWQADNPSPVGSCHDFAYLGVDSGAGLMWTKLTGHICGIWAQPVTYRAGLFRAPW